jgi:DNA-binding PadR family transcriptional regulator
MPMEKLERKNTFECLWPYVLRILKDRPSHAYVLREEIEKRFGFRPGNVTAYFVLYSLQKKGCVKKEKVGRKKIYTITPKGKELLKNAMDFYSGRAKLLK